MVRGERYALPLGGVLLGVRSCSNPEGVVEDDGEYQSSRQAVERSGTPANKWRTN